MQLIGSMGDLPQNFMEMENSKKAKAWELMVRGYPWQWWINFDFPPKYSLEGVQKNVKGWLRYLAKVEKLQIAAIFFVCRRPSDTAYHVHCPAFAISRRRNKTLKDVPLLRWGVKKYDLPKTRKSFDKSRKGWNWPLIIEVYRLHGLAWYHGTQFYPWKNKEAHVYFYNIRLLLKVGDSTIHKRNWELHTILQEANKDKDLEDLLSDN